MAQNETKHNPRTIDIDKNIVSNIDNGIVVLDTSLSIYHYNRWLELHTNLKEENLLNKKIYDVFPDIKIKTLERKIKTALRMQTPTFYTASTSNYLIPIKINQLTSSRFEYMQQDISIIPFDQEKDLVALILTDQTNMANTHALLKANILKIKELNSALLKERDTIDKRVLLIKISPHGMIKEVSQALLNLLKYDKEELYTVNFFAFERVHIDETLKKNILKAMNNLESYSFEQKTLTKCGKELWLKNRLVPEYDTKNEHIGFIFFRENITDTKIAAMHNDKLLSNSRSAAMGEMISMIAHQWRQPLSLINTIIATMKVKKELDLLSDETMTTSFGKIESTVKFLSETIDDFRDYFKPNKVITNVNLYKLFTKSISFLQEEMTQMDIEYSLEIDSDANIQTYKNELLQTIINVLKNSIDAFNENAIDNQLIQISFKKYDTHISLTIKDNAGGIDSDILKRVFEPYFSTKSKNGTGLGLYMCKTIINEHLNGKITITSLNSETTTLIELPYSIKKRN